MTDLVPYNRLVRKRNCSLQHQLNVTLHMLTEEYRQIKERMYKDERECGRFLQSLYSTIPGLQTYGHPDTRAMNADASLKERRFSLPAPGSHAGNNVDDDDNRGNADEDKNEGGDDLGNNSAHRARRRASGQPSTSPVSRPASAPRRPSAGGGDLRISRGEENDRAGRKTSFARQLLPRPGTAATAGTGNRKPRGHVTDGSDRPVTAAPGASGGVVGAAAAAVRPSTSPWSHHGYRAYGSRKARAAAALYGMPACSERERRLHQQVIGKFKVIFDPLRKVGGTLSGALSPAAAVIHVAMEVSPVSQQPGNNIPPAANVVPPASQQSAKSAIVAEALLKDCSNSNTSQSNNNVASINGSNKEVDHQSINGSFANTDKADEGRRKASGRRVVWSAHPTRRKEGVVAAPDLAALDRPSSEKSLRAGPLPANCSAVWRASDHRTVTSCPAGSQAPSSSVRPVSGGGAGGLDPKVRALALVRHPLLAHGWTAGSGDGEELSDEDDDDDGDVFVADDDGDSEVGGGSKEHKDKVDKRITNVDQEAVSHRTTDPASWSEPNSAIHFSKSATHEQHVASPFASPTRVGPSRALEIFISELAKDETTHKPLNGVCSRKAISSGESASVKACCATDRKGACSHQLDKKQDSSAAKKTRTSSSGRSLPPCHGIAHGEAAGSVGTAAWGPRPKRPTSPRRHSEEAEAASVLSQQDPRRASKPPPMQLMARLMASGLAPGATASAAREPSARRPAPSTAQLGQRSVPAPRQTVAGILAQMENQKASTRALLDTSLRLQKVVKKLVPMEELLPAEEDDSEDQ